LLGIQSAQGLVPSFPPMLSHRPTLPPRLIAEQFASTHFRNPRIHRGQHDEPGRSMPPPVVAHYHRGLSPSPVCARTCVKQPRHQKEAVASGCCTRARPASACLQPHPRAEPSAARRRKRRRRHAALALL
jgi:hypothetical protein